MRGWLAAALFLLLLPARGGAEPVMSVVADLPYGRVWAAALEALREFPLRRVVQADGLVETDPVIRAVRDPEADYERIEERVVLKVEAFGERITRITCTVEARGRRGERWEPIRDTTPLARRVLERIEKLLSG